MVVDILSAICPISKASSIAPSSSSHQIRKTLGRQQPSLQVSPLSFFSLPRNLTASLLGNIAIGNLQLFLPFIVHLVKQDDLKRLLALHALKEVVTHTSTSHLENLAETLWVPLFENSESADESERGVAAACIGKLITTHPARYLPQVHVCITEFIMTYVCSHVFRPASATRMLLHEQLCCQRSGTLSPTHLLPSTTFWPRT